jgi:hypothetical protein
LDFFDSVNNARGAASDGNFIARQKIISYKKNLKFLWFSSTVKPEMGQLLLQCLIGQHNFSTY